MSNLGKQPENNEKMIIRVALTHDLNCPRCQIITLLLDNAPLPLSRKKNKIILAKNLYSLVNYLFMDSSLYIYFILMYPKLNRMDRTIFYFKQDGEIKKMSASGFLADVADIFPSKSCIYIKLPEFNQINRSMRKNDNS